MLLKETAPFMEFIESYNDCFYRKDLEGLKGFYAADKSLIYLDNHPGNDTHHLDAHLKLLSDFFEKGKKTESGAVEPISTEQLSVFRSEETACLCYLARYQSFPDPPVRVTMYLERLSGAWKIRHVHCSFEPRQERG
jgi:hypothetical protein